MTDTHLLPFNIPGQFILCKKRELIHSSWNIHESNRWLLGVDPGLPVLKINLPDNSFAGWIVGFPIAHDTRLLDSTVTITEDKLKAKTFLNYGGRYICIILKKSQRLYLDPGGTLPVVYSKKRKIAASSLCLFPEEKDDHLHALVRSSGMPFIHDGWYPFGLTPRKSISRLLPNHYLDLDAWNSIRHWPTQNSLSTTQSTRESIRKITGLVKNTIQATAKKYPLTMSLTAGRDSRLMLACSKDILEKITFFTLFKKKTEVDCHIAKLIGERFNLHHQLIQIQKPTESQIQHFLHITGHSVSIPKCEVNASLKHLGNDHIMFTGMAAPVGKAKYSKRWDRNDEIVNAAQIINRLAIPFKTDDFLDAITPKADQWLAGLSGFKTKHIMDLLHIEQRNGCWGAPQTIGDADISLSNIWPCNHRKIYSLIMNLPLEYCKQKKMHVDIINNEWPELLELPLNSYVGLKKLYLINKIVSKSIRLAKQIRW